MRDFIINFLTKKLPISYYYHSLAHTLYVTDQAIEIARHEGCTKEEIALLEVAALWHDSGYVSSYAHHEYEGCILVKQYLPNFGYSDKDINQICGMIMATKIPQSPQNKLEQILADADLEYLGTEEAATQADLLFRELKEANPSLTEEKWNQMQISFIEKHQYFTKFCQENRTPTKLNYLQSLY